MKVILKDIKDISNITEQSRVLSINSDMKKFFDGISVYPAKFESKHWININNDETFAYDLSWVLKFIFEEGDDLTIPYVKKAKFDQEMEEIINDQ